MSAADAARRRLRGAASDLTTWADNLVGSEYEMMIEPLEDAIRCLALIEQAPDADLLVEWARIIDRATLNNAVTPLQKAVVDGRTDVAVMLRSIAAFLCVGRP